MLCVCREATNADCDFGDIKIGRRLCAGGPELSSEKDPVYFG